MKKKLIILSYLCFAINCHAQESFQHQLDSLTILFKNTKSSPQKVDLLILISNIYFGELKGQSYDSAYKYTRSAYDLSKKTDYQNGLAKSLYDIGRYYVTAKDKPAEATKYFLNSLNIYKKLEDEEGISSCYMQLGIISYVLQNYEAAVKSLELSLKTKTTTTSKYLLALSYTEIDNFDLAKKYFSQSISDYSADSNQKQIDHCYLWLGRLYIKTGGLDTALYYFNKSIKSLKTTNDQYALVRPYAFVSEAYLESNKIQQAIYYAEESYHLQLRKTVGQHDELSIIQASKVLSKAYAISKNYKKAYFFLDLYNTSDSRFKEGSTKEKVADMQSMFQFNEKMKLQKLRQQKDKEIATQQIANERILRNAFVIGTILLLLFLGLLYNRFNIKKKANNDLQELNEVISFEKNRSDDLLLNILPADIAQELKLTGKAEARDFENVSILFTDFKKFTEASEKLSAKELVAEVGACFEAFDLIVEKYQIEKIKTIGDAYMAAGGLGHNATDTTKNIVLAALEMQQFITKRTQAKTINTKITFEMRAGIHTGGIVAGIVGVKKFQYDLWGDTVNTASRMESNGEVRKVNISQATYELIKDNEKFTFEHRGKIAAKGKGEIDMWFVELS